MSTPQNPEYVPSPEALGEPLYHTKDKVIWDRPNHGEIEVFIDQEPVIFQKKDIEGRDQPHERNGQFLYTGLQLLEDGSRPTAGSFYEDEVLRKVGTATDEEAAAIITRFFQDRHTSPLPKEPGEDEAPFIVVSKEAREAFLKNYLDDQE